MSEENEVTLRDYNWNDVLEFCQEWADENDFTADMMQGIVQMGINAYETTYSGYALAMQAYSNHEESQKEG